MGDSESPSNSDGFVIGSSNVTIFVAVCALALLLWWCCRRQHGRRDSDMGCELLVEEGEAKMPTTSAHPDSSTVWTTADETAYPHGIYGHPHATLSQPPYHLVIRQPKRQTKTVLRRAGPSIGKYLRRRLRRKGGSASAKGSDYDRLMDISEVNGNINYNSPGLEQLQPQNLYTTVPRGQEFIAAKSAPQGRRHSAKRAPKAVPKSAPKLYSLTIATDATPDNVGGYCIDFAAKTCEYYSFPTSMLPQCLAVKRYLNSAEFEMNNLAFALLYWEPLILERRRLHMYTDNNAVRVKGIRPEHGEKVRAHLEHLEKCEGVKILNRRMHHVNRKTRAGDFEKYIVPADDLSRRSIEAFKAKIHGSFPKITEFFEILPAHVVINEV